MKHRILLVSLLAGVMAIVIAFATGPTVAVARPAKNLKVLPKGMEKRAVKRIMKKWAKALDVECEHCHDIDDMPADSKEKKRAREMLRMTNMINKTYMKKFDGKVTCMTCHRRSKKPKK